MRDKTGLPEAQIYAKSYDIYADLAYASVGLNIDTLAVAIRDAGAVMIGATGHNVGWSTAFIKPPALGDGQPTWGHACVAIEVFAISDEDDILVKNGTMTIEVARDRFIKGISR